ncbi:MAG: flagellar basal-body rod protein FlgF [Nitrospinae bacterium]|nr:flagellar basal-body rod protein FlgF [Nitrospinota bacterium]
MHKDMYVSASGHIAAQKRLDTIANNLANINTPGFKSDQLVFESYLANAKDAAPQGAAVSQTSQSDYVMVADQYTDFTQGVVKTTENPLDVAIDGEGFFSVMTSQGEMYTRNGAFKIGQNGELVTSDGHIVLDDQNRAISVRDGTVTIDEDGSVWVGNESGQADTSGTPMEQGSYGKLAGKLKVVSFPKSVSISKEGSGLYKASDPSAAVPAGEAKVMQGSMEQSNVNMIGQMTELIKNQRLAETYQKAVTESDNMTSTLLMQVGR